jgi:glycosyltransferase involved in cell wall biosynthesis
VTRPDLPKTLFVARGAGGAGWYRCALPAMALGLEWLGVQDDPPNLKFVTGLTKERLSMEDLESYEVLVVQQPNGTGWTREIRRLQDAGVKVLFEIDDYVQAVRKMADHDFGHIFNKDIVRSYELNMRLADGLICSTEFLAERYRTFNPNAWVCRNGIDLRRYAVTKPPRDTVTIGWAGGTGHKEALKPWLGVVADILREHEHVRFLSIGARVARDLIAEFGLGRVLSLPFAPFETYPAAMTLMDVAIAPAGRNNFFRGKSDLRWLEASALSTPVVADPLVYPEIQHGVTGLHAATPAEVHEHLTALVTDAGLRARIGEAAHAYVTEHRTIQTTVNDWATALQDVASGSVDRAA